MKTFIHASLIALTFFAASTGVFAETRGIHVSESDILADVVTQWPYTTELLVSNQSDEVEWIEVRLLSQTGDAVAISPSMFALDGNETGRVVLSFEDPAGTKSMGVIRVSATRNNPGGLETGTGIEIPYVVSKDALRAGDLRAAAGGLKASEEMGGAVQTLIWMAIIVGVITLMVSLARRMSRRI